MSFKISYQFSARVWQHSASGGWYFVSLPIELTKEIRRNNKWQEEGWGRMKSTVKIGETLWETAIWFDTKHETYLLPLKAEIRRKEKIEIESIVQVTVWI